MSEPTFERVVVAIPTFRRPVGLARLLEALARLRTRAQLSVLVADNDAETHAGFDLCRGLEGYRWPLTCVIAPTRGIADVRNVLIAKALESCPDFVAMIDDDEWPDESWLESFLAVARQTQADVLQGSILFHKPAGWGGDGFDDIRRPTGPVAMLQGAGNILIRTAILPPAPWFDSSFALGGGEDRDFFERLSARGARFAWADYARCFGAVPQSRATLSWSLKRAYSIGNSDMRVLLKHHRAAGMLAREGLKIAGALLLSPVLALAAGFNPYRRAAALRKGARAAGKLAALFGAQYQEYAAVHGE
jgi:hypothetical protein